MNEALIAELETAARIVMQPPNQITREQRQLAENVIMKFRRTSTPYAICREIFEKSKCDLLIFEAADTLRRSIVAEWSQLQTDDRTMLRQYLLTYCIDNDIPSFIRAKILQVVAIMIKRSSIIDNGAERLRLMVDISTMITAGDLRQQFLGCKILYAIMQEFLITIRSDDTGLTFEEHFRAKKLFELGELKRIFVMTFQAAEKIASSLDGLAQTEQHLQLLGEYITLAEMVLMWGYVSPLLPNRLINALEMNSKMDQSPALRLSAQWAGVVLDPKVLEVFFGIYWKVRDVADLQSKALTCIVQFSTLNGPVISQPEVRTVYVVNYLTHFLQLIASRSIMASEAHGMAVVFRKIILHTNENCWLNVSEEIRNTVLQQMFSMTCNFMDLAVKEDDESVDDIRYRPALEIILEAWLLVLQMRRSFAVETLQQYSVQMFNKYLQSHLSWAATNGGGIGTDPSTQSHHQVANEDGDKDEDDQDERTDNERFEEQLTIIGMFGREHLACTLPTLCNLLEERTATLREQLLRIYTAQSVQPNDSKVLAVIYDDIQWIVMVAGHVVSMNSSGEDAVIPSEIRNFCLDRQKQGLTDVTASLSLLAAPAQTVAEIPNAETGADLIVRLVAGVFRLCDLENKAIELKMVSVLSPEVSRNNMWFVHMWASSYLLEPYAEPSNQTDAQKESAISATISVALKQSFGIGTDGGKWTVDFVLNKICVNVRNFYGERKVVDESLDIFTTLCKSVEKAPVVFQSDLFKQITLLRHLEIPKANLLRGLTMISNCISPVEMRIAYLRELMAPIEQSFKNLEWQQAMNSHNDHAKSTVSLRLAYLLDEIRACCSGASASVSTAIYTIFQQILENLADVLDLFHNFQTVVVSIFELLCTAVERLRGYGTQYNAICIRVVRVYVKHNANRVSLLSTAEEDSLEDLQLLLKLSKYFLQVALFDVGPESESDCEEVCLTTLQYILPMVTMDMLKYPTFCLNFYETLQMFVDKSLIQVQPEFMAAIIQCTTMGLQAFGAEIQSVCLGIVNLLASTVYYDQNPESYLFVALRPSVQLVFGMILRHDIDTDNRNECCRAMFTMLCAYRRHYDEVMTSMLQTCPDPAKMEKLRTELMELVQRDTLSNNRIIFAQFTRRFEKFMAVLTALT